MQILLTTHAFYPDAVAGGGVARYADTLARALLARGHRVALLTTSSTQDGDAPGARYQDGDWHGLPVRRLAFNLNLAPSPYGYEWDNPWVNARVLEYARELRPDVVHMVHGGHLSMSAVPLLRRLGIVVIGQLHDYWLICPMSNLLRADGQPCLGPDRLAGQCIRCVLSRQPLAMDPAARLMRAAPNLARQGVSLLAQALPKDSGRWSSARAQGRRLGEMRRYVGQMDALLCPTRFSQALLRRNGFSLANVRLLPLGIQPPRAPAPLPPRPPADPLRVVFLGRLEPRKGVHLLVEAVRTLPAALPLVVEIVGYEEDAAYVRRLRAAAAGEPRLVFRGAVADAGAALPGRDVLVLPATVYEMYPLVLREGQAAGLVGVASRLGGMAEVVREEVDGLLFRAGDAADLARQLRRLAEEPGLLARLRGAIAPPLTVDAHAEALLALYAELLEARRAAPAPAQGR